MDERSRLADAAWQACGSARRLWLRAFRYELRVQRALRSHPVRHTSRDGKVVLFKADTREDHLRKQQNFYRAFAYIQQDPKQYNNLLHAALGCSKGVFVQQVVPTLFSVARKMSFLDWNLRLWEWNHTEHFVERVTFSPDGFPIK